MCRFRKILPRHLTDFGVVASFLRGFVHNSPIPADAFPWGAGHGTLRRHAQVSRQAMHYAHKGINALMSCDKAFQNPCHSAKRERKYVQQHIRICTHGVKTGLG